jgi:aconitate hydratase
VVGKFVEFYGPASRRPAGDRATIGNMSPEYGSTCAIFPIDDETVTYLRSPAAGRDVALVEAYAKEQGLWHDPAAEPRYSETLELDLVTVVPSLAGPKRPQDRVSLTDAKTSFREALTNYVSDGQTGGEDRKSRRARAGQALRGGVEGRRGLGRVVPGVGPGCCRHR